MKIIFPFKSHLLFMIISFPWFIHSFLSKSINNHDSQYSLHFFSVFLSISFPLLPRNHPLWILVSLHWPTRAFVSSSEVFVPPKPLLKNVLSFPRKLLTFVPLSVRTRRRPRPSTCPSFSSSSLWAILLISVKWSLWSLLPLPATPTSVSDICPSSSFSARTLRSSFLSSTLSRTIFAILIRISLVHRLHHAI